MELLAITLAQMMPGKENDGQARIHLILDTVRNAQGQVASLFYRSRGDDGYYLILTSWEDEDSWQQAQERHSPRQLLVSSPTELLTAPPEQWLMHYHWGYSRPGARAVLAAAHLATIRPDQADLAQRGWIESLRRQAVQPTLAFAFLARGVKDATPTSPIKKLQSTKPPPGDHTTADFSYTHGSLFLNLLSWASEADREDFYADQSYKTIRRFLNGLGVIQTLALEPVEYDSSS